MMISFKEHSKSDWGIEGEKDGFPGLDKINAGSLQRIADATEAMAKNHIQMERDLIWYRNAYLQLEQESQQEILALKHSRAGYMAALTKLRRKLHV